MSDSWTAARQASLSFTISWSLPKFTSIESVMLSSHLTLCCPLLLLPSVFPSITVFSKELAVHIRWQASASASASVLPMSIQGWFPLGLTGWVSLQSKGPSRVFCSTTIEKHQCLVLSFLYEPTLTSYITLLTKVSIVKTMVFPNSHIWMLRVGP